MGLKLQLARGMDDCILVQIKYSKNILISKVSH